MSMHSMDSLVLHKQYVNLPTALINKIRELFGPALASAWEVFYAESRKTHGVINKTYAYLARKIGCSRRTVIRYVKKLSEAGIIIVNHRYHHDCSIDNEFILLSPDEAILASKNSSDRMRPIDIDYSVDYLAEEHNSVDKSVTICHPSISDLNTDINNKSFSIRDSRIANTTKPKTAITALRQEEASQNPVNSFGHHPKSVSCPAIKRIEKIVKGIPGVSSPSQLVSEAIHFVANRKNVYGEWHAVGAFAKIVRKDGRSGWSTPWCIRKLSAE